MYKNIVLPILMVLLVSKPVVKLSCKFTGYWKNIIIFMVVFTLYKRNSVQNNKRFHCTVHFI